MDRRAFGTTMLLGGLGLAAPAMGQGRRMGQAMAMMQMGPAERRHHMDTLQIGGVALETSRMAQSRAENPMVRQFADFEVEEQTTVSQILNEMMRMPPPPPPPADRRMMQQLAGLRGREFDRMYLTGQLDGHRRLLTVQETYLSQGRDQNHRHIAMLARGRILEHIREAETLQRMG
jgi:putative membrane protein